MWHIVSFFKLFYLSNVNSRMELEEPEDEEWKWNTTSTSTSTKCYLSEPDGNSSGGKVSWVFKRGLNLGKKILVAGLVASSAPIVVPPLVVASAIGIAVSVPYAFFLASHACTENLMSKLLPRRPVTIPHDPPQLLDEEEEVRFQQDVIRMMHIDKEEQFLVDEKTNGGIGMVGVEHMNNDEKDLILDSDYGQGVLKPGVVSHSQDAIDVIQHNGSKEDECECFCEDGDEKENAAPQMHDDVKIGFGDEIIDYVIMEGHLSKESEREQQMSGGQGVVITVEGLEENGNGDVEEFKAPFEVTTVSVEEFGDEAIEGDIEEEELQRETRGLLEKIRDEGRNDSGGEYVDGIHGDANESDHEICPLVEDLEVAHEENQICITTEGAEGDAKEEEDRTIVGEEMLDSSSSENNDTVYNEVESAEPVSGMLKEKEVDNMNDSPKQMGEHSELLDGRSFQYETIPAEPVGELVIEHNCNIPVSEDSSEVTSEKIDIDIIVKEEPEPVLDGPTVLEEGKLGNNISDSVNQESQLHEHNETMDLSDADATQIADEKRLDRTVDSYTIDLHEESSNVMVDRHTAPIEVPVSTMEQELRPSEYSSQKDIMCPSPEVVFDEESIWKQIHVIRKIIGYEATTQASCADELKALYIFTGVEPPTFLNENSIGPAEINEKLHFLMSIVGIK